MTLHYRQMGHSLRGYAESIFNEINNLDAERR